MQRQRNKILFVLILIVWTAFGFLASQFFLSFLAYRVFGLSTAQLEQPLTLLIYDLIVYSLMLFITVGVPHIFAKHFKNLKFFKPLIINREKLGLKDLPTWTDLGLAPAGLVVYFILAALATGAFSAIFPWFDAGQTQDVGFNFLSDGLERLAAFVTLVVIAPIAEEVIFRGWLYGRLRVLIPKKFSLPVSMLIVSALFGLLHLQWNVGVNVFCLSLVLCALREITGTIHSGILLHMLKNGIAFYLLYVLNMV